MRRSDLDRSDCLRALLLLLEAEPVLLAVCSLHRQLRSSHSRTALRTVRGTRLDGTHCMYPQLLLLSTEPVLLPVHPSDFFSFSSSSCHHRFNISFVLAFPGKLKQSSCLSIITSFFVAVTYTSKLHHDASFVNYHISQSEQCRI